MQITIYYIKQSYRTRSSFQTGFQEGKKVSWTSVSNNFQKTTILNKHLKKDSLTEQGNLTNHLKTLNE